MPRNIKRLALFSMTVLSAFIVTACAGTNSGQTGSEGRDRLVAAQSGDPVSLDLHRANDVNSSLITGQMFETLVTQNMETMAIEPALATDWRLLEDGVTWEFDLRQNVVFHNGEPFTADDVLFTFQRAAAFPQIDVILGMIDTANIVVVDDYTIHIPTFEPFAPFLRNLSHTVAGIMNREAVETAEAQSEAAVSANPVGTGPFEFVQWVAGDFVELRRFEDFYGDLPAFETLIVRTIAENSNRIIELETGAIDIAITIDPNDINRVENSSDMVLHRQPNFSTQYLGLNTRNPILADVRVRQALNYAVDVESIVTHLMNGVGSLSVGPIGSNVWGFNNNLTGYGFDLDRARELLAEAGIDENNRVSLNLWTSNAGVGPVIAEAVQAQLRVVGIDVTISPMEWATYIEALNGEAHDMFVMGWGTVTGDADYGLYSLFHSQQDPSAGNRFFLDNPRIDEILDEARTLTDDDARRLELYHEVQEIIVEEAPWIFLWTSETVLATRAEVQNFELSPVNHHRFRGVTFAE